MLILICVGLLLFDKDDSQKVKSSSGQSENHSSKGKASQNMAPKVRSPANSPVRVRTSIQPMIRKSIQPVETPPSQTVAPLESADRTTELEEQQQQQVMECQEPAGKKARVMQRGEEPTLKQQQAEKIKEPVMAAPLVGKQHHQAEKLKEPVMAAPLAGKQQHQAEKTKEPLAASQTTGKQQHVEKIKEPVMASPLVGKQQQQAEKTKEAVIASPSAGKQQHVEKTKEPVIAEKQVQAPKSAAEPVIVKPKVHIVESEVKAIDDEEETESEEEALVEKPLMAEKQPVPVRDIPAISKRQLEAIAVESQTLPSEIFEEPQNEEVDSGLDNEKQGDAADGSIAEVNLLIYRNDDAFS